MNARQKAKRYKKIAEANQEAAKLWHNHILKESLEKQAEKKIDFVPVSCCYFIPVDEIKYIGEQRAEDLAKSRIATHVLEIIMDEIKISKSGNSYNAEYRTNNYGVEYRADFYIGIKEV